MSCSNSMGLILFVIMMMAVPFGSIYSGSEPPPRADDPDLSLEDIWLESGKVSCRVVNLGQTYQGSFTLNLTVEGSLYYQEIVDWNPGQGSLNVTFPQSIVWMDSRIVVGVEIYYHISPLDGNLSNNLRIETWNRQLPDLIVRSVYRDPSKGNLVVLVENTGPAEGGGYFHVDLRIEQVLEPNEFVFEVLSPGERVEVPFLWTWDRKADPVVNITVQLDLPGDVNEMNVSNNIYHVTWRSRDPLFFNVDPFVESKGSDNAVIRWETSIPASAHVEYGICEKMIRKTGGGRSTGSVEVTSLKPSTQYFFRVVATDALGRTLKSEKMFFLTERPEGTVDVEGGFEKSLNVIKPGISRIPFSAGEKSGFRKVDLYLDGKLIRSDGLVGKSSVGDLILDMTGKRAGNHTLQARVETLIGDTLVYETKIVVDQSPVIVYPKVRFDPNPTIPRRGTEWFSARCEDPGGVVNASWFVNGVLMEVDEARHPDSSYFGPLFTLDTTTLGDGNATIGIEVRNHQGNVTSVERTVNVDNLVDPPDPEIWVRRDDIIRSGTTCTVPLRVSNHGRGTAVDIVVEDWIKGFVPINGESGTQSCISLATEWKVVLTVDSLDPGEEVTVTYDCIPAIHEDEEWELGAMRSDPFSDDEYTTMAHYMREDRLVDYDRSYGIPAANFEEGYTMRGGALDAISKSNYMALTVPISLSFAIGWRPSDELLMRTAYLASLKWGVFAFAPQIHSMAPTEEDILNNIVEWSDLMSPYFSSRGYLLIIGEDDVVPGWNYDNVLNDGTAWRDVDGSDQGYSSLDGDDLPDIAVGRIIGTNLHELLTPVNTSIYVHEGGLYNDPNGKATLISGGGSGVQQFQENMIDLGEQIAPSMRELNIFHKGGSLPVMYDDFLETDGISGHMAAGDVDGDSLGEVVIINPAADRVVINNPDYGGSFSFDLVLSDDAKVLVGDMIGDATMDLIVIDQSAGNGWLMIFETDGDLRDSWIVPWDPGDHVCLGDIDRDGTDDLIIASGEEGDFYVVGEDGEEITEVDGFFYRPGSRIASADMNDDGWDDIVICNHIDDEVEVYINQADMSEDLWTQRCADVAGLDPEDGFAAGGMGASGGDVRDYAVVIQSDQEGQFTQVWIEWDGGSWDWESAASTTLMTDVREDCSVYVAEMMGDDFTEEIVVCEGPFRDNMYIMDLGNIGDKFREDVTPHIPGNDLMVFRDHGNEMAWSGLYNSDMVDDLGIASASHRPVVFGSVCLSGRYFSGLDSFAHACLRNGAGVYISAIEVSLRSSNNAATRMIVDYTEGTPIGKAYRNFERDFLNSPGSMGLSDQEARYWCYEYNYYGDPAFGTSGFAFPTYTVMPLSGLFTREDADLKIGDPVFVNYTGGKMVSLPGGYQRFEIGDWVRPYMSYVYDIPRGQSVSSVSVSNESGWRYYRNLTLPPLQRIMPDDYLPTRSDGGVDPDDNWDPGEEFEWRVASNINGNRTLVLNIYPFHYDVSSLMGRFCSDWSVSVNLTEVPVEIADFQGPGSTPDPGDPVRFVYELDPLDGGGTVSISHRIEDGSGEVVEVLSSSVMDVNVTTRVEEEWVPGGPGDYKFVVEIKDGGGNSSAEYMHRFRAGTVGVAVSDLTSDPQVIGTGGYFNVSMTVENIGNVTLDGNWSISLLDDMMEVVEENRTDLSLDPGEEVDVEVVFDNIGDEVPEYYVVGRYRSVIASDSMLIRIPGREDGGGSPPTYSMVMEVDPIVENLTDRKSVV